MKMGLWARFTLLLMAVCVLTFVIAIAGFVLSGVLTELIFQVTEATPETQLRLEEIDAEILTLEEEADRLMSTSYSDATTSGFLTLSFVVIAALCLLFAAGVSIFLSRWLTRPVLQVEQHLQRLVAGDFTSHIPDSVGRGHSAEIRRLCSNSNRLAQTLDHHDKRIRKDAAVIAHELRTPLTAITSQIHALKDGVLPPEPGLFNAMLTNAENLGAIINDLRTMSLAEAGKLELDLQSVDLARLLGETIETFQTRFDAAGITVNLQPEDLCVTADEVRLAQAIRAIFDNVLRHAKGATQVNIRCSGAGEDATIQICDNGCGLPEDTPPYQLFRAFSGGSRTNQSSGLGLAVTAALLRTQGGAVSARNQPEGGACFTIKMPLAHPE